VAFISWWIAKMITPKRARKLNEKEDRFIQELEYKRKRKLIRPYKITLRDGTNFVVEVPHAGEAFECAVKAVRNPRFIVKIEEAKWTLIR
jgi:hypothetical protein